MAEKNGVLKTLLVCVLMCVPFTGFLCVRWYKSFEFDIHCGQHIKRAADSNTVDLASKEMEIAVKYLEDHKMTEGYTTIFQSLWLPPSEDVSFWYTNLKTTRDELRSFTASHGKEGDVKTKQEQQAVLLLKLRQTLLDHSEKGETITTPSGISIFPANGLWFGMGVVLFLISLPGMLLVFAWAAKNSS